MPPLLALLFAAVHAAAGVTSIPDTVGTPQVGNSAGGVTAGIGSALAAPSLTLLAPSLTVLPAPSWVPSPVAAVQPAALKPAAAETRHIIFDVRGSRGGHGDVAAAYLTAYDLLDRTAGRIDALTPSITFIAGATERRILSRLAGREVKDGGDLFDGFAKVYDAGSLPAEHPPADVLMNLAAQDGAFARHADLHWAEGTAAKNGRIPVTQRSVILTQTVFGNTESSSQRNATALVSGRLLELSHAGLARNEAGIYADPVARSLRGRPREDLRRFVLAETEKTEVGGAAAVAAILKGEVLAGAEVGLAYGVSMQEVKPQFERYLLGLANQAARTNSSFVLVTPSGFTLKDVKNSALRARIVIFEGDRVMPVKAEPGKIYVLKTGTLPHPLFVGLMAYSRPPPVLSGDGAMSAAIGLGRPFVLTKVGWNDLNIQTYAERLSLRAPENKRELIKAVYLKSALERSGELDEIAGAFAETSRAIPTLTDTMFAAVQAARDAQSPDVGTTELIGSVNDPVLKASLIALRSMLGDADAQELAAEAMSSGDRRTRRLIASALLRSSSLSAAILKPLLSIGFHPINMLAARLALSFSRAAARRRATP